MRQTTPRDRPLAATAFLALLVPATATAEPWRISDQLPDWLTVEVHNQSRIELLDEQFREGLTGGDRLLAIRTGVFAEARWSALRLGGEIADMRFYLHDDNTPLNTAFGNPLDILQAYVAIDGETEGRELSLLLGRFTLDLGSRRFIARNRYRNTINAFTGAHLHYGTGATTVDAFASLPVRRRPFERDALADNELDADTESFDRIYWGLYVKRTFGAIDVEPFVFGRHDRLAFGRRDILSPGLRFVKAPAVDDVHFEVEAVLQLGEVRGLEHRAAFLHTSAGYTFDVWSQPSVMLTMEYATGDADPNDDESNRFDRLYGVPRPEYGPTMIYSAFSRANLFTPGVRIIAKPLARVTAIVTMRSFVLADANDAWVGSGYRDRSGESGAALGEQFEIRVQYDVFPNNLRLEAGLAHLWRRGFAVTAAQGAPTPDPTIAYLQLELTI